MLGDCLMKNWRKSLGVTAGCILDGTPITKDMPGYCSWKKCFIQDLIKMFQEHIWIMNKEKSKAGKEHNNKQTLWEEVYFIALNVNCIISELVLKLEGLLEMTHCHSLAVHQSLL